MLSTKKNKNINIKQLLKSLKENLNLMEKEKNKKLNYIKNKNEVSKKKIKHLLFPFSNDSKQIEDNIKTGNNKIYHSVLEINQLQILNFQIQNEIEKTNYLIEQKAHIFTCMKSVPFSFELYEEYFVIIIIY